MKKITEINPKIIRTHKVRLNKAYEYAKMMENGQVFPPVRVYKNENGQYICKNGAHRIHACRMLNRNVRIIKNV